MKSYIFYFTTLLLGLLAFHDKRFYRLLVVLLLSAEADNLYRYLFLERHPFIPLS